MINADLIDFSKEQTYSTYDSYLKLFNNVKVSASSVIFKNGCVVADSLYNQSSRFYYQTRYLLKKMLSGKKVRLVDNKKYLLATDQESVGHFHWFTEVLPRLYCVKDLAREFVLLLPDHPYVRQIGLDSLELLRLNFEDIRLMESDEFYKVRNLYYVSKLSRTGQPLDDIMQLVNKKFLGNRKRGRTRIYVSRENADFRKVLNEKEVFNFLQNYGFETLRGEEFSLSEQIDIFSKCDTLLGIHGAGLTNCFFMFPKSKVIELRRKEAATNNGYWHLADSLKHDYYYYNGIPDSDKSIIGRGCNLTIPIDDFHRKIMCALRA